MRDKEQSEKQTQVTRIRTTEPPGAGRLRKHNHGN